MHGFLRMYWETWQEVGKNEKKQRKEMGQTRIEMCFTFLVVLLVTLPVNIVDPFTTEPFEPF